MMKAFDSSFVRPSACCFSPKMTYRGVYTFEMNERPKVEGRRVYFQPHIFSPDEFDGPVDDFAPFLIHLLGAGI